MNEENLAVSDNSEEPQTDQQNILNLTPKEEPVQDAEQEAMPHIQEDDDPDEPIDWGERPDWIQPQFWNNQDGPDVEGVFRAYNELRSKMDQGLHKAPKDGAYNTDIITEANVSEDDEMLTGYVDIARKHGISQDAFNELASLYFNSVGEAEEVSHLSIEQEKAKLGRNAEKIIGETEGWLVKMNSSGVLNDNEREAIANASSDGYFISAMNKIRQSYNEAPIPTIDLQEGTSLTREDLDAMVADERYGKDMIYTSNVEKEFMKAFGEA